jgi:tyrosyl-tRNA synthetase
LAGRTIQKLYGQAPQDILTTELLLGTDGRKMSSSWGNVINLVDLPQDMFGKVMSIKDELIEKYFTLATRMPRKDIREILRTTQNPRDQKLRLAFEITALYHGKVEAAKAQQGFLAQFSRKELPKEIPEKRLKPGQYGLVDLLGESGLAASKTEARRLLQQGGVKVDQAVVKADLAVVLKAKQEILLQVGKRKYLRLVGGG